MKIERKSTESAVGGGDGGGGDGGGAGVPRLSQGKRVSIGGSSYG